MSGLDFLRAFLAGEIPPPPIARLMNFLLTEVDEGRAVFEGEPEEYHYNPIGVVHGGLALTLLDSALGCAVQSTLPLGAAYTTLETKANLVRAITSTTGHLRCEAKVVHVGRSTATAEGRLTGADGKLYAHGTTTCLILRS
ncbi:MAG TPA: PaaI family thioesterase [Ktedonobacterales bacterium]|nr:PaaI family thioesterase [Ktedonobacterales bacterium]